MDWHFSLAGLLVGFLVGLTGMGGGSLLAPILLLIFQVPPIWAVGTDLAYSTVTKAVGSVVHIQQKFVNFKVALWLALGSVPATLISVFLVQYVHKHSGMLINTIIIHTIGVVLLLVAATLLLKPLLMYLIERRQQTSNSETFLPSRWETHWQPLITVLIGAAVGFLVGLTSVGSGTLIIISLFLLYPKITPKELVGTDVFQALLMLLAGSIGYLFGGGINWTIVSLLLIGSLPGVLIGSRLSKYVPDAYLRPVLAIVLALSGWKLI